MDVASSAAPTGIMVTATANSAATRTSPLQQLRLHGDVLVNMPVMSSRRHGELRDDICRFPPSSLMHAEVVQLAPVQAPSHRGPGATGELEHGDVSAARVMMT